MATTIIEDAQTSHEKTDVIRLSLPKPAAIYPIMPDADACFFPSFANEYP
jgi:hypothetical protein